MKKLLLLSLVASAFGLTSAAFAQAAGPAGGTPQAPVDGKGAKGGRKAMEKMNEEILAKLNLTDDQKAKLKAHREETETKLKELRKSAKGAADKEAVKEKAKAIQKENQAFMKQTLTKEQMREYQKLRREALKARQEKAGEKKPKA